MSANSVFRRPLLLEHTLWPFTNGLWKKVVIVSISLLSLSVSSCVQRTPNAPDADNTVTRVESLLKQEFLQPADAEFILALTAAQIDTVLAARLLQFSLNGVDTTYGGLLDVKQISAEGTALGSASERIEVQMPFQVAAWWPTSWAHSNAICGGDNNEHIFLYMNVPGAYADRARMKIFSFNAGVLLALKYYQLRQGALDSRVYTSNNIYVCVGSALHVFLGDNPGSHETWLKSCVIWKS